MTKRYYYVYLRNDVVIGAIETFAPLTGGVEVSSLPKDFLYKKYINGQWSEPQKFRFAHLNEEGVCIYVDYTYFPEDLESDQVLVGDEIEPNWTYLNGSWSPPVIN